MKLALIAMSGVRVRDPELQRLGLSLPGFVERGRVIASLPSLGLLTLGGATPTGVELSYLEHDGPVDADTELHGDFDAVAISSFTARIRAAYRLADLYRARGVKVILGGLHVTARPEEARAHADAVVVGEAEPVWGALVEDLRAGSLRERYDGRAVLFDLADSQVPRFDLLGDRPYDRFTVQTQRGCPWDCAFCAASIRLRPGYRTKGAAQLNAELDALAEHLGPRPFLELADDNTFASPAHGRRVVDALAPRGLRWFTETDVSFADHPDLVARAADAGCVQVLVGLESPSASSLAGVERQADWKSRRAGRYLRAIDVIQSRGIAVNGCFVLGLDGAGPGQFDDVLDFVRASGLHEVQVTVQTAFPGTPLHDELEAQGRLLDPTAWERCTLFDVNFRPTHTSVEELRGGLHRLTGELYTDEAVAARRAAFRAARRRAVGR